MTDSTPTSTKPYLIRAIHEWCSDNGLTPYLAVSVNDQVQVPKEHVRNGEIVLNVGMLATDKLQISNDTITFQARFSGRVHQIMVPIENVVAIYAKETGNGMAFELPQPVAEAGTHLQAVEEAESASEPTDSAPPETPSKPPSGGRPRLTRVK
ncbi:MAG: ClpXP protease specificity-enhancing factor [Burkholderiaceae bacterium]|nr:ClpXP protease specificity-enhancing factor [Burkholderiaceae bacterium]